MSNSSHNASTHPIPDSSLSVYSPWLIQEGYEIPGSTPVLKVQMTLEVIRDMIWVSSWEGGAYWAYHLLAGI